MSHIMRKPVLPNANNKDADQPAHLRSLISAFVVRCLDSIITSFYIRNFKPLPSFCGWAGQFESTMVANPEDRFSHDVAYIWTAKIPVYIYGMLDNEFEWVS